MSDTTAFRFNAVLTDESDVSGLVAEITESGGEATIEDDPGLLPLGILLIIIIPPGVALIAHTISKILHGWKDKGTIIDARGEGPPTIMKADDLPHSTIVILTRDGDVGTRTDLPDEKLSDYIGAAIKAVVGGAGATAAAGAASAAIF